MAIKLNAGTYWKIKSIRIDPIHLEVSVIVGLWLDAADFVAHPSSARASQMIVFPLGAFRCAEIDAVNLMVEKKLTLQPQFAGGIIL